MQQEKKISQTNTPKSNHHQNTNMGDHRPVVIPSNGGGGGENEYEYESSLSLANSKRTVPGGGGTLGGGGGGVIPPKKKRARPNSPSSSSSKTSTTTTGGNITKDSSTTPVSSTTTSSSATNNTNTNTNATTNTDSTTSRTSLAFLCLSKSWIAAKHRAQTHPHESEYGCTSSARTLLPLQQQQNQNQNQQDSYKQAKSQNFLLPWKQTMNPNLNINTSMASSPLALACRYGAPSDTIQAILNASKVMVRRCIPNRGTPLHEAIMMCRHYSTSTNHMVESAISSSSSNGGVGGGGGVDTHSSSECDELQRSAEQEMEYVSIIRMLIEADEELELKSSDDEEEDEDTTTNISSVKRATLMQDVDGNVPLHLLVRQAFYNYVGSMSTRWTSTISSPRRILPTSKRLSSLVEVEEEEEANQNHPILSIIRKLIKSSPEAVAIPDFTEYEETPLILALKSSLFANEQSQIPSQQQQQQQLDDNEKYQGKANLERQIFNICKLMLSYHPEAASLVVAQSGYTAVHSAVFHGRCSDTIRLLLRADLHNQNQLKAKVATTSSSPSSSPSSSTATNTNTTTTITSTTDTTSIIPAAMRANSFGELPLHFAAMRGECTRSLALLSQSAPRALLKRDVKLGMTPLHWLWVRFVDTLLERFQFEDQDQDQDQEDQSDNSVQERQQQHGDNTTVDQMEDNEIHSAETPPPPVTKCPFAQSTTNGHTPQLQPPSSCPISGHSISSTSSCTNSSQLPSTSTSDNPTSSMVTSTTTTSVTTTTTTNTTAPSSSSSSSDNGTEEEGESHFDLEYHIRTQAIDPPVDFFQMRHICPEHKKFENYLVSRILVILRRVQERHRKMMEAMNTAHQNSTSMSTTTTTTTTSTQSSSVVLPKIMPVPGAITKCPFVFDSYPIDSKLIGFSQEAVLEEQVISLFWAKVTSLLHAVAATQQQQTPAVQQQEKEEEETVVLVQAEEEESSNARSNDATMITTSSNQSSSVVPQACTRGGEQKIFLLHTACAAPCTSLAIAQLCIGLYPEQLKVQDSNGKLPLHHIASRILDPREYPMEFINKKSTISALGEDERVRDTGGQDTNNLDENNHDGEFNGERAIFQMPTFEETDNGPLIDEDNQTDKIIENETAGILSMILNASPSEAARTYDNQKRLPLHCAIDTFLSPQMLQHTIPFRSSEAPYRGSNTSSPPSNSIECKTTSRYYYIMNFLLKPIIQKFPGALERRDGTTGLFPFMQVATMALDPDTSSSIIPASSTNTATGALRSDTQGSGEEDEGTNDDTTVLSIIYSLLQGSPHLVSP